MKKRIVKILRRLNEQTGQALLIVLALFMIGSLTLPPILAHIGTSLKSETVYKSKTNEYYAADSGVEDAIWQIKYDRLGVLFANYDMYDFTDSWNYNMDAPVNGLTPSVTVANIWMPKDITPLDPATAKASIESNKLIVAGTSVDTNGYKIKISFTPGAGEQNSLKVNSIGIWLPLGFTYNPGTSNLEADTHSAYYSVPVVSNYKGGKALVWSFHNPVSFSAFPGVSTSDNPEVTEITFNYTAGTVGTTPVAIAWMTTSGVSDVPLSWDIDTRMFSISASAGDTTVDAVSSKCELRKMGAAIAGDYRAIGNSLMIDTDHDSHGIRDQLLTSSSTTVADIPADADVVAAYLYWSGWIQQPVTNNIAPFPDTCSNFNNWSRSTDDGSDTRVPTSDGDISGIWNTAPCWDDVDETTQNDADYMTGTTDSGGYKLFNFSAFNVPAGCSITNLTVYVRAKKLASSSADMRPDIKVNGTRHYPTSGNNPSSSSFTTYSYSWDTNPDTSSAWTAADINGTGTHPLQQFGVYTSDLNPDVEVSMVYVKVDYTSDSRWSISSNKFQGQGSSSATTAQRTITLKNSLNLSSYASGTISVIWDQDENGNLSSSDTLYYAVSADGGNTWSSNMTAFHDDNPSSPFTYTVPDAYLTNNFKIRFYFNFDSTSKYVYLDNIKVVQTLLTPDTSVLFKINDTRVYFDAQNNPQSGGTTGEVTAGEQAAIANSPGYSYACHRDVTQLLKTYSDLGANGNHTGNGIYTVGNLNADTGNELSYGGWSIIIVYSSPETAGHQLYLYDAFAINHGNENLDFDNDGQPGGDIKGFLVPEPITGEVNAATLTCFVGEGDNCYSGDSLTFAGTNLSDGYSTNNVWNSKSLGMSYDGVDIDTFYVSWASHLIEPGDTTVHIDMPSGTDNWNLVYMILSMRSETVTGGTTYYYIHGQ